jgi:hypothetical protein
MLKLKTLITEADGKLEKIIRDIQKNTDTNNHTEAVLILAKFLKDNKKVKILNAIEDITKVEGHTPSYLLQYRNSVLKELLESLKDKYDNNTYMRVSSAF